MPVQVFNEHPGVEEVAAGSGVPNNVSSLALAASLVVKAGPGVLYGFTVYSSKTSSQFIQLHDTPVGVPADGAVPVWVVPIATVSDRDFVWIPPRYFGQGIVICNSSTAATKTIGSADCFFDAQYL